MAFLGIPAVAGWLGGGATGTALAAALYGGAAGAATSAATGGDWKKGALKGAALGTGVGMLAPGALGIGAAGAGAGTAGAAGAAGAGTTAATTAAATNATTASTGLKTLITDAAKDSAKLMAVHQAMAATTPEQETTIYGPSLQWIQPPQLQWGSMLK